MRDMDANQEVIALLNSANPARRKSHRLPLERYSASDCEFFITICARHQRAPFTDNTLASQIIDALLWYREKCQWRLFCYCLMPDHLHFIAQLPDALREMRQGGGRVSLRAGILDWIGDFKSYTTSQCWWKRGGEGALWQRSSYDRVIRYNDSVEEAVNYVLRNPVRKNLAGTWEDYPYAAIVDEW